MGGKSGVIRIRLVLVLSKPSPPLPVLTSPFLCRTLLLERGQRDQGPSGRDPYQEVGSILTNVTREPSARLALAVAGTEDGVGFFLGGAARQLRSKTAARRRGCATTLRNLAFKAEVGFCTLHCSSCL